MRGIQIIFSGIAFIVIGGMSWYFMSTGKERAEQAQREALARMKKHGVQQISSVPKEARPIAKALKKKGHYVECFNGVEKSRKAAVKRYFSWIKDPKTGPTGKERHVYGIYKIHGMDRCKKQVEKAKAISVDFKELNELAKLMDTYVVDAEKVVKLAAKIKRYYTDQDYKDDKFAKGKKLHSEFLELLTKLQPTAKKFTLLMDRVEDTLNEQRVEYFKKKYGEKIRYLMVKGRIISKNFALAVHTQKDPAKIKPHLDELVDIEKKLADRLSKDSAKIKKEVFSGNASALSTLKRFARGLRTLITKGKLYYRALKANAEDPKKLKKFLIKSFRGSFAKGQAVLKTYNRDVGGQRLTIPW
jgi:hypothetical protein